MYRKEIFSVWVKGYRITCEKYCNGDDNYDEEKEW